MIADPREMKLGLADYLSFGIDEHREREIIRGKLYSSPKPYLNHQVILSRLTILLSRYVESMGDDDRQVVYHSDLLIDSRNTYVSPDLMYFNKEQMPALVQIARAGERISIDVAFPVMVAEVLSEYTRDRDLVAKPDEYEQAGIRHYWIIDPQERSFREFVLDETTGRYRMFASAGGVARPKLFADNEPPFDLDLDSLFR